jgi:mono/diheme cytochrome c family protein
MRTLLMFLKNFFLEFGNPARVQTKFVLPFIVLSMAVFLAGCGQGGASSDSDRSQTLAAATHAPARLTFSDYPVPPKPEVTPALIATGKQVYEQNCAACHGMDGDAQAEASAFLLPKPRNFQEANYRLRSTPSGSLPTDVDLYRSVSLGMPGTPMPPWQHMLTEHERWAVVEYCKTFSPRFADEDRDTVVELGTPPARNPITIAEGKELYGKMACFACHGEGGRGDGPAAVSLTDDSGGRSKARDLTWPAAYKSGYSAREIARSVLTGFNGTPMLGFHGALSPEEAWKIAYFVEALARPAPVVVARPSRNFLERETLGAPDVRIKLTERAWKFDPAEIRVKKGQIVEITFEPTDNGLGVGHGFAISSYDEVAFINGAMVGAPKTVKFRADRAGKFSYYCSTQCSTDKLHPLMNGTFYVEDNEPRKTAALD